MVCRSLCRRRPFVVIAVVLAIALLAVLILAIPSIRSQETHVLVDSPNRGRIPGRPHGGRGTMPVWDTAEKRLRHGS